MTPDARSLLIAQDYAHRGLWSGRGVPENSLRALCAARQAGFGVELDIRLSADGEPYVFHDTGLRRMTGVWGDFETLARRELSQLSLPDGSPIPTLAEALDRLGETPLRIELKAGHASLDLAERVYEICKGRQGVYFPKSFDVAIVRRLRDLDREHQTFLGVGAILTPGKGRRGLEQALDGGAEYLSIWSNETRLFTSVLRGRNIPIAAWTVNQVARARRLANTVDMLVFDGLPPDLDLLRRQRPSTRGRRRA